MCSKVHKYVVLRIFVIIEGINSLLSRQSAACDLVSELKFVPNNVSVTKTVHNTIQAFQRINIICKQFMPGVLLMSSVYYLLR